MNPAERALHDTPMLRLFDNGASVAAQKVRIVLHEKGLPFESTLINLRNGEVMAPEYLALNPRGVVPTLLHEGRPIVESTVIVEYLDDRFPDPPLRPADAWQRARMRLWMKRMDDEVHRATGHLSMGIYIRDAHLLKTPQERADFFRRMPDRDRAERQMAAIEHGTDAPGFAPSVRVFAELVDDIETGLVDSGCDWLAGDRFSLADAGVVPYVTRLDLLTAGRLWVDGRRPTMARWLERVRARPSWQRQVRDAYDPAAVDTMRSKAEQAWPRIAAILDY